MDAGLDNANNPFTNSNGSLKNLDTDNVNLQKNAEGLLLNLTDNFKANGTDLPDNIFGTEKSNGTKKSSSDIHFDDDFGPETDVDAVDDAFSPVEKKDNAFASLKGLQDESIPKPFGSDDVTALTEELVNNNPLGDVFNPFRGNESKVECSEESKEINFGDFQGGTNREETPTPPADTVHDAGGLEVNPTESDSEDEWNYIQGDQAKPANLSSQPETVVETAEQDDAMSQLNPDAAEFVPVSPTRSIPSPACRLIKDEVISQSPKRPVRVDIKLPSESEFESEVKSRPSDFDENGHHSDSEHNDSLNDLTEHILNGKNVDEIPEFHPGSTPSKLPSDEFHFGPNAAPFTPKALDQSEAFSTKANFGDDTQQTLNESEFVAPSKEQGDPMSMSFYAEKGCANPFQDEEDLNKVHELPENLDAFLQEDGASDSSDKENREQNEVIMDDTISDLPEHDPLGRLLDNDQATIQTTDLDKLSQEDEKELASPLETGPITPPPQPREIQFEVPMPSSDDLLEPSLTDNANADHFSQNDEKMECQSPISHSKSPLLDLEESNQQIGQMTETSSDPKSEVESIHLETKEDQLLDFAASPVPACEYSADPESCEFAQQESQSPIDLLRKPEEEEITSSVKDDVSSPIEQLSPVKSPEPLPTEETSIQRVDSSFVDDVREAVVAQHEELANTEIQSQEISSQDHLFSDFSCPMPQLQSPEAAFTNDLLSNGLDNNLISELNEQICIKTDSITPEFAQPAILTPSEDSRAIDEVVAASPVPAEAYSPVAARSAPFLELESNVSAQNEVPKPVESSIDQSAVLSQFEPQKPSHEVIEAPIITETQSSEPKPATGAPEETPLPAPLPLVAVTPAETKEAKVEEKKTATSSTVRKSIGKVEPRKSTSSPRVSAAKPSPKPAASSPKTTVAPKVPAKTGTTKPTGVASKTSLTNAAKPLPKPKTTVAPKVPERKPTADVKPLPRTTLAKKPSTEAPLTKTSARPASAAATKTIASKPTGAAPSRPATAPRSAAPPKAASTAPRPAPATTTPKPRVPLSHRTASNTAAAKTTTSLATKPSTTGTPAKPLSSPRPSRTAVAAPPKPRTITSATSKPRVPLTKTVTKSAADVEKEKKESANKLTASRSVAKTTSTSANRTATTTTRKTEIKTLSDRTAASKTTKTTTTVATRKTNGEIKPINKPKTTKIEKPKENGIAPTSVTEEIKEITVNQVVSTAVVAEPSQSESEVLVKDNSPIDNKLITTSNSLIDANPAD